MTPSHVLTAAPDNRVSPGVDERLSVLLMKVVAKRGIHHATMALASGDGKTTWSAAAGPADFAPHPDRPFFIASITKRFIITLVLQAHERGELDLSAPINNYLAAEITSGLHTFRGIDWTPEITVRHLASHTSGLPDHFERRGGAKSLNAYLAAGHDVSWTFDDMLQTTREEQHPFFEPQNLAASRQKARYSDTGFQLLIRIIETATERSFAELLTERILDPLGMKQTWPPGARPPEQAAAPMPLHAKRREVHMGSLLQSSNDLYSTAFDLLRFHRALLAGGLFSKAETLRYLTERRNRLRNIPVLQYGLGTMFFNVNRLVAGRRGPATLVGHSGGTGTWLFYCPERDLHVVGTVDQTKGSTIPYRIMTRCLNAW